MSKNYENIAWWAVGILAVLGFTAGGIYTVLDDRQKSKFKLAMKPVADGIQQTYGIAPIVTITQAAHESNWGTSKLTQEANNLFGFTGESWEKAGKPTIKMPTKEYVNGKWVTVNRPFRAYTSWSASARDWADLLSQNTRYAKAILAAKAGNFNEFATQVQAAGYATDPNYANALINLAKVVAATPEATV